MNILFVCTGNTCRSPMAEAILNTKSQSYHVQSAGLYASVGAPASKGTRAVLQDADMSLAHEAQQVTNELIQWADVVLTMTHQHKQLLTQMFATEKSKYYTLKEYNKSSEQRSLEQYKNAYKQLEAKQATFKEPEAGFSNALKKEVAMTEYVEKEFTELQKHQAELSQEDIQDPFGQNKEVYQATFNELEKEINKLMNKKEGGLP